MNSINNAQIRAESFNKSREIIAGLLARDSYIETRFLSYEKKIGIYPVLAKVLYSPLTPKSVLYEFPQDKDGDRVPAFAAELFNANKITKSKLESIKAENDGSIYSFIKQSAVHLIQDKARAWNANVLSQALGDNDCCNVAAEDQHRKFEARDLLGQIIDDAKLNCFQKYIIEHLMQEYAPKDIVKSYSTLKKKPLTLNYYYAQASLAMKRLKAVSVNYKWCYNS